MGYVLGQPVMYFVVSVKQGGTHVSLVEPHLHDSTLTTHWDFNYAMTHFYTVNLRSISKSVVSGPLGTGPFLPPGQHIHVLHHCE